MEFFPALLATRAAYKALQSQQPVLFKQLLDNSVNGMALADSQAWAACLELLHLVSKPALKRLQVGADVLGFRLHTAG